MGGTWASLFSGGKDSAWALYRARESDREVSHLVTVHPSEDSYMYHVPATRLARLAAKSIGIPLLEIDSVNAGAEDLVDAGEQGDKELVPLERSLDDLAQDIDLDGITTGAVESEYQRSRLQEMCDRLGIELYAPLWKRDPTERAKAMLDTGFDIRFVQVAAQGLDASWLGRQLDRDALAELIELNKKYGVHILGEGGEYETIVVNGPHMERPIEIEFERHWAGNRGHIEILNAWLECEQSDF